jgi:hypothetical protein
MVLFFRHSGLDPASRKIAAKRHWIPGEARKDELIRTCFKIVDCVQEQGVDAV